MKRKEKAAKWRMREIPLCATHWYQRFIMVQILFQEGPLSYICYMEWWLLLKIGVVTVWLQGDLLFRAELRLQYNAVPTWGCCKSCQDHDTDVTLLYHNTVLNANCVAATNIRILHAPGEKKHFCSPFTQVRNVASNYNHLKQSGQKNTSFP